LLTKQAGYREKLPPRGWLPPAEVCCDFDGTITQVDITDAVLEAFALPAFREWEQRWQRGEINSQECLARQVELIRADQATLVQFVADLPIDEGIFALDQRCAEYGTRLMIVSDGIDLFIKTVLSRHGLSHIPVFSSRLNWDLDGRPSLSFPYAVPGCQSGAATCKCALAMPSGLSSTRFVYIGDGQSDWCVSAKAHKVFAKRNLRGWCKLQGIACEPFETLTQVTEHLFRGKDTVT